MFKKKTRHVVCAFHSRAWEGETTDPWDFLATVLSNTLSSRPMRDLSKSINVYWALGVTAKVDH